MSREGTGLYLGWHELPVMDCEVRLFPPAQIPAWHEGMPVTFSTRSRHTGHGHVIAAHEDGTLRIPQVTGESKLIKRASATQACPKHAQMLACFSWPVAQGTHLACATACSPPGHNDTSEAAGACLLRILCTNVFHTIDVCHSCYHGGVGCVFICPDDPAEVFRRFA